MPVKYIPLSLTIFVCYSRQVNLHVVVGVGVLGMLYRDFDSPLWQAIVPESSRNYVHYPRTVYCVDVYHVCLHAPLYHATFRSYLCSGRLHLHPRSHYLHDSMPWKVCTGQIWLLRSQPSNIPLRCIDSSSATLCRESQSVQKSLTNGVSHLGTLSEPHSDSTNSKYAHKTLKHTKYK